MAESTINAQIKQKVETVTFNNRSASVSLLKNNTILLAAVDTNDWGVYVPRSSDAATKWQIYCINESPTTRTVKLYYMGG